MYFLNLLTALAIKIILIPSLTKPCLMHLLKILFYSSCFCLSLFVMFIYVTSFLSALSLSTHIPLTMCGWSVACASGGLRVLAPCCSCYLKSQAYGVTDSRVFLVILYRHNFSYVTWNFAVKSLLWALKIVDISNYKPKFL